MILFIIFKIEIFCQKCKFKTALKIRSLCHEGEKDDKKWETEDGANLLLKLL